MDKMSDRGIDNHIGSMEFEHRVRVCIEGLKVPLFHLPIIKYLPRKGKGLRTLQALFSSKPSGASTLSVWPRSMPVNRLSRSITATLFSSGVFHLL